MNALDERDYDEEAFNRDLIRNPDPLLSCGHADRWAYPLAGAPDAHGCSACDDRAEWERTEYDPSLAHGHDGYDPDDPSDDPYRD